MLLTTSILKARMDISEIIMHEDYNSNTVDQDFALLKMARKVRLSWKRQKSLFSRNSWTGPRTRTSDRHACQALVLVTMTSGCPQSQVLFLFSLLVIVFRMVLLTMIMIIMTIKKSSGWGTTSSGGSTSNVLLEVDVKVKFQFSNHNLSTISTPLRAVAKEGIHRTTPSSASASK